MCNQDKTSNTTSKTSNDVALRRNRRRGIGNAGSRYPAHRVRCDYDCFVLSSLLILFESVRELQLHRYREQILTERSAFASS